jgi:hypothetical protein
LAASANRKEKKKSATAKCTQPVPKPCSIQLKHPQQKRKGREENRMGQEKERCNLPVHRSKHHQICRNEKQRPAQPVLFTVDTTKPPPRHRDLSLITPLLQTRRCLAVHHNTTAAASHSRQFIPIIINPPLLLPVHLSAAVDSHVPSHCRAAAAKPVFNLPSLAAAKKQREMKQRLRAEAKEKRRKTQKRRRRKGSKARPVKTVKVKVKLGC